MARLHSRGVGRVQVAEDGSWAGRGGGAVFSGYPLYPGDSFTVRVEEANGGGHAASLLLGLTAVDPAVWDSSKPVYTAPDTWSLDTHTGDTWREGKTLGVRGAWKGTFGWRHTLSQGDTLSVALEADKRASVSVNGAVIVRASHGLPAKPLWVVIKPWVAKISVLQQVYSLQQCSRFTLMTHLTQDDVSRLQLPERLRTKLQVTQAQESLTKS